MGTLRTDCGKNDPHTSVIMSLVQESFLSQHRKVYSMKNFINSRLTEIAGKYTASPIIILLFFVCQSYCDVNEHVIGVYFILATRPHKSHSRGCIQDAATFALTAWQH